MIVRSGQDQRRGRCCLIGFVDCSVKSLETHGEQILVEKHFLAQLASLRFAGFQRSTTKFTCQDIALDAIRFGLDLGDDGIANRSNGILIEAMPKDVYGRQRSIRGDLDRTGNPTPLIVTIAWEPIHRPARTQPSAAERLNDADEDC
jgi:hypothetical protein